MKRTVFLYISILLGNFLDIKVLTWHLVVTIIVTTERLAMKCEL
ncbi:putative membrane protein [Bacillus pseudomycoides]|nr:putative membrane protein [Bacillus pseudomycoides]